MTVNKDGWRTIELLGYSYYSGRGYSVLIKLVTNFGYDFVIEKDNQFKRVNVKVAGLKDKSRPNDWSIAVSNTKKEYLKRINCEHSADIFLVWIPQSKSFIELPGNFFDGHLSCCVRIPKLLTKNLEM